jgi:hypothetical protein
MIILPKSASTSMSESCFIFDGGWSAGKSTTGMFAIAAPEAVVMSDLLQIIAEGAFPFSFNE